MKITAKCPGCGAIINGNEKSIGQKVTCKKCQAMAVFTDSNEGGAKNSDSEAFNLEPKPLVPINQRRVVNTSKLKGSKTNFNLLNNLAGFYGMLAPMAVSLGMTQGAICAFVRGLRILGFAWAFGGLVLGASLLLIRELIYLALTAVDGTPKETANAVDEMRRR